MKKTRIIAALSGGVDSSTAAALLKEAGNDVIGATLQLHPCHGTTEARSCCGFEAVAKARETAGMLGIPHYVINMEKEFEEEVLRPSWEEYRNGRTPNPCILCNERIKFGRLLKTADSLGATHLATGHYSRLDETGKALLRGVDPGKDQSYFLATLGSDILSRVIFPLGGMLKSEVRVIARRFGLPNAERVESQDMCLIGAGETFSGMLLERFGGQPKGGNIFDDNGVVVGTHKGIHAFTVGQRRGLGFATGKPAWVRGIDSARNIVFVTHDENKLFSKTFNASGVRWISGEAGAMPLRCEVQVRYRQRPVSAEIHELGQGSVGVNLVEPIRAVTPGQAAVFFDGDRVLGGGWIDG